MGFKRSDKFSKDEWRVGTCTDCGFVYLQNVPVYDRLVEEFAWEKTWVEERARRVRERPVQWRVSLILRKIRAPFRKPEKDMFINLFKPGPILDVGCGVGDRIPDVFTPYGIELSKKAFEVANANMKSRGGFCIHAPAIEGIGQFKSKLFTGIILRSFLEHEWQPMELLSGAYRVLSDSGAIFIRVPNYASLNRHVRGSQWCGFRYPDHVNYFTPDSLSRMAGDSGFDLKLLNPLKIAIDDNIKALLTKRMPAKQTV